MSSVLLEDYEYFQLFDPDLDDTTDDDSDLDDPVVRRLLSGRDGRAGQRGDCLRKCGCVCLDIDDISFVSWLPDIKFHRVKQHLNITHMLAYFFSIEIRSKHVIIVVIAISICVLTIGLVLGLVDWKGFDNNLPEVEPPEQGISAETKPSPSKSVLGNYSRAAVATDGEPCAQIGVYVALSNFDFQAFIDCITSFITVMCCEEMARQLMQPSPLSFVTDSSTRIAWESGAASS